MDKSSTPRGTKFSSNTHTMNPNVATEAMQPHIPPPPALEVPPPEDASQAAAGASNWDESDIPENSSDR